MANPFSKLVPVVPKCVVTGYLKDNPSFGTAPGLVLTRYGGVPVFKSNPVVAQSARPYFSNPAPRAVVLNPNRLLKIQGDEFSKPCPNCNFGDVHADTLVPMPTGTSLTQSYISPNADRFGKTGNQSGGNGSNGGNNNNQMGTGNNSNGSTSGNNTNNNGGNSQRESYDYNRDFRRDDPYGNRS